MLTPTMELAELKSGLRLRGLVAAGDVTIVAVEPHGESILNVVYRGDDGQIADRLLTVDDLANAMTSEGGLMGPTTSLSQCVAEHLHHRRCKVVEAFHMLGRPLDGRAAGGIAGRQ